MENIISNVAVVFRGQRRHLMLKVAATLKQSHGSRLHVYCSNEVEAAFVRRSDEDGLFDTVTARGAILRDGLMTPESELNAKAVFAEARRYEALLGLPYNTLIVGDTGCGQGYAQAAYHWPRSPLHDGASYLQMLNAYNSVFAFWEREINDKQLTLLLNGDNVIGHVCRAFGVPFRFLEMARYRNYWFWAHNSYLEDAEIEHAYEAALIAPSEVDAIVDPYQAAPYEIAKLAMRDSLRNQTVAALLRNVARATVRQAYLWLRRPEKARNRTLAAEVRRHWRFWRDAQRMRDPSLARLADIRDTPYVFFGLQFEPENSIGQLSPEYFFQHAAIAALSSRSSESLATKRSLNVGSGVVAVVLMAVFPIRVSRFNPRTDRSCARWHASHGFPGRLCLRLRQRLSEQAEEQPLSIDCGFQRAGRPVFTLDGVSENSSRSRSQDFVPVFEGCVRLFMTVGRRCYLQVTQKAVKWNFHRRPEPTLYAKRVNDSLDVLPLFSSGLLRFVLQKQHATEFRGRLPQDFADVLGSCQCFLESQQQRRAVDQLEREWQSFVPP